MNDTKREPTAKVTHTGRGVIGAATAKLCFHEVCELFDVGLLTDCMGEPPNLYRVYALGEKQELSAGLRGFYMTPWFRTVEELENFCTKHIERFLAAATDDEAPAPDATGWEYQTSDGVWHNLDLGGKA